MIDIIKEFMGLPFYSVSDFADIAIMLFAVFCAIFIGLLGRILK